MFADAKKAKQIGLNPADDAEQPRRDDPEMRLWDAEQMRAFLATVAIHRLAGVWQLLLTTGMCQGEPLGPRWTTSISPRVD